MSWAGLDTYGEFNEYGPIGSRINSCVSISISISVCIYIYIYLSMCDRVLQLFKNLKKEKKFYKLNLNIMYVKEGFLPHNTPCSS